MLHLIKFQICLLFFIDIINFFQSAISSYFDNSGLDFGAQLKILNRPKPMANFQLRDDGVTQYYSDTAFSKQWVVTNSGEFHIRKMQLFRVYPPMNKNLIRIYLFRLNPFSYSRKHSLARVMYS